MLANGGKIVKINIHDKLRAFLVVSKREAVISEGTIYSFIGVSKLKVIFRPKIG